MNVKFCLSYENMKLIKAPKDHLINFINDNPGLILDMTAKSYTG